MQELARDFLVFLKREQKDVVPEQLTLRGDVLAVLLTGIGKNVILVKEKMSNLTNEKYYR